MIVGKRSHSAPSDRQNVGIGLYKRLIPNLLLLLVSFALCSIFVEMFVRFYYGDRFAPRPSVYVSDDLLGWRPRPNLDYVFHGKDFKIWIKTDDDGYRLGRLDRVPATSNVIVAIGDSHTFGWGVDTDQTYPSYLDERIAGEGDYRVVNLGVGGYSTLQSALRLQRLADRGDHPRIRAIVMLHANNDIWDNARFIRVAMGMVKMENYSERSNSMLHSINFLDQAIGLTYAEMWAEDSDAELPFLPVDQKRGFREEHFDGPKRFDLNDGRFIETSDINPEDMLKKGTKKRGFLKPIQDQILREGIQRIDCAIENEKIVVIHVFYEGAWPFFETAVRRSVEETDHCGNGIYIHKIPRAKECKECGRNPHSGGHANPARNSYRADQIYSYLKEAGVFTSVKPVE